MSAEIYAKINRQCTWWDTFAKIVPISGVMIFLIIWFVNHDVTEALVFTGLSVMCVTLALWWYWAVTSIAHLAHSNWVMHEKMHAIHQELTSARHELKDIRTSLK